MKAAENAIIVGVLGQWASGKTSAARTLIDHLGGSDQVIFITDRELFIGQVVNYLLSLDESEVTMREEPDGKQRMIGPLASVLLRPGQDLRTADVTRLRATVHDDVMGRWHNCARVELGLQIVEMAAKGRPIVIEAAFGPDPSLGAYTMKLSIPDLFERLSDAGVGAGLVRWIIVEADFDTRAQRNRRRPDQVPLDSFDHYAADGGDLTPQQQQRLEAQGFIFSRIPNNHDDFDRFKADIISTFEKMFAGISTAEPPAAGPITPG